MRAAIDHVAVVRADLECNEIGTGLQDGISYYWDQAVP